MPLFAPFDNWAQFYLVLKFILFRAPILRELASVNNLLWSNMTRQIKYNLKISVNQQASKAPSQTQSIIFAVFGFLLFMAEHPGLIFDSDRNNILVNFIETFVLSNLFYWNFHNCTTSFKWLEIAAMSGDLKFLTGIVKKICRHKVALRNNFNFLSRNRNPAANNNS